MDIIKNNAECFCYCHLSKVSENNNFQNCSGLSSLFKSGKLSQAILGQCKKCFHSDNTNKYRQLHPVTLILYYDSCCSWNKLITLIDNKNTSLITNDILSVILQICDEHVAYSQKWANCGTDLGLVFLNYMKDILHT